MSVIHLFQSLSPGGVRTEFGGPDSFGGDPAFQEQLKHVVLLNPEDVANAVVYVLSTPPHVQVHK